MFVNNLTLSELPKERIGIVHATMSDTVRANMAAHADNKWYHPIKNEAL